jgi:ferredoxin
MEPETFSVPGLMYAEGYGNLRKARQCFRQLPAHLRAKRCESCAGCTVRCPYGVRVRDQVTRAQAMLS